MMIRKKAAFSSPPDKMMRARLLAMCGFVGATCVPVFAQDRPSPTQDAIAFITQSQWDKAGEAADRALALDPDNVTAHLVRARVWREMHAPKRALPHAKAAHAKATDPRDRYNAALLAAQALSSDGKKGRAQIWLRRALDAAPDHRRRARAARDFRYVRATNPWRVQARFGLRPSNNINGGPSDNTYTWNGLVFVDPSAVPLSGLEIGTGVSLQRRMSQKSGQRFDIGMKIDSTTYVLSPSAKQKLPGAKGSDYAQETIETLARWTWKTGRDAPKYTATTSLGASRYGGAHLSNFARVSLSRGKKINRTDHMTLFVSGEQLWRIDNDARSSTTLEAGLRYSHQIGRGGGVAIGVSVADVASDSTLVAHERVKMTVNYRPEARPMGVVPNFGLGYEMRAYDHPHHIATPRHDDKVKLSASATFPKWERFGFAPQLGINASRTKSNVRRYDSEALGLDFTFKSVF